MFYFSSTQHRCNVLPFPTESSLFREQFLGEGLHWLNCSENHALFLPLLVFILVWQMFFCLFEKEQISLLYFYLFFCFCNFRHLSVSNFSRLMSATGILVFHGYCGFILLMSSLLFWCNFVVYANGVSVAIHVLKVIILRSDYRLEMEEFLFKKTLEISVSECFPCNRFYTKTNIVTVFVMWKYKQLLYCVISTMIRETD